MARGLGKGLDSLIPNAIGEGKKNSDDVNSNGQGEKGSETVVKITSVEPNREQPRKNFDSAFWYIIFLGVFSCLFCFITNSIIGHAPCNNGS